MRSVSSTLSVFVQYTQSGAKDPTENNNSSETVLAENVCKLLRVEEEEEEEGGEEEEGVFKGAGDAYDATTSREVNLKMWLGF